jgi:predicted Zn-dependent protease
VKRNPENEVAHYQLAQAYRALGKTAEQEKALAEFNRLRSSAEQRRAAVPPNKRDVTRQDADVKPPK